MKVDAIPLQYPGTAVVGLASRGECLQVERLLRSCGEHLMDAAVAVALFSDTRSLSDRRHLMLLPVWRRLVHNQ